jgi:hypothetical protein
MSSAQAIEIAKSTRPSQPKSERQAGAEQAAIGDPVSIVPTDYGLDPVYGELVAAHEDEWIVLRSDARAGDLHVHFPRIGYQLTKV